MDFLKEHLSDELFTQLQEALKDKGEVVKLANLASGEFVRKDKFDGELGRAKKDNDDLTKQVTSLQTSLDEVKNSTDDIEKVKADAAKAVQDSKDALGKMQTDAKSSALDYEIRLGVVAYGAKDETSVLAHVDKAKVTLGDDGKLTGLNEQLGEIKTAKEYLFGDPKKIFQSTPPNPPSPEDPPEGDWAAKHKKAKESGNQRDAIKVKQAAAKEGVILD